MKIVQFLSRYGKKERRAKSKWEERAKKQTFLKVKLPINSFLSLPLSLNLNLTSITLCVYISCLEFFIKIRFDGVTCPQLKMNDCSALLSVKRAQNKSSSFSSIFFLSNRSLPQWNGKKKAFYFYFNMIYAITFRVWGRGFSFSYARILLSLHACISHT